MKINYDSVTPKFPKWVNNFPRCFSLQLAMYPPNKERVVICLIQHYSRLNAKNAEIKRKATEKLSSP